jgi:hypothetical protein
MPAGQLLQIPPLKEKIQGVLRAAQRAGVEVVREGRVSPETEAEIQKPIFSAEQLAEMANRTWDGLLKALEQPAR